MLAIGKRIRIVGRGTSLVGYTGMLTGRTVHDDWLVRLDSDDREPLLFGESNLEALPDPEPHIVAGE
jgi:hypothetical protein